VKQTTTALVGSVIYAIVFTQPTYAQDLLPCRAEREDYQKAEQLWANDPSLFASCTTYPDGQVSFVLDNGPSGGFNLDSPQTYFADRLDVLDNKIWLHLRSASGSNCSEKMPKARILLEDMECKFRGQLKK
jgi:hypothetical protein